MMSDVERFADFLIEWITNRNDIVLERDIEFRVIKAIVESVEEFEKAYEQELRGE